jgi:radical SAM superfamily enzyme
MAKIFKISIETYFMCPNSELRDTPNSNEESYYCYAIEKFISKNINEFKEIHPLCPLDDWNNYFFSNFKFYIE